MGEDPTESEREIKGLDPYRPRIGNSDCNGKKVRQKQIRRLSPYAGESFPTPQKGKKNLPQKVKWNHQEIDWDHPQKKFVMEESACHSDTEDLLDQKRRNEWSPHRKNHH